MCKAVYICPVSPARRRWSRLQCCCCPPMRRCSSASQLIVWAYHCSSAPWWRTLDNWRPLPWTWGLGHRSGPVNTVRQIRWTAAGQQSCTAHIFGWISLLAGSPTVHRQRTPGDNTLAFCIWREALNLLKAETMYDGHYFTYSKG